MFYPSGESHTLAPGVVVAVVCPSCEHIHFETNRAALPSHCTACGHDLSQPVATPPAPELPPPPAGSAGNRSFLLAGISVLCFSGWLLLSGLAERARYLPVMATVTASYLEWAEVKGHADLMKGAIPGLAATGNSFYVVDGKTYRTTIDRRWRLGDRFEVWYLPESPEEASEVRPYSRLLASIGVMVAGLFLLGRGFGVFGAAIEPPVERVALAEPTVEEAEAIHETPSFAAEDVRARR